VIADGTIGPSFADQGCPSTMLKPLTAKEARPETPPEAFDFETTAQLDPLRDGLGQERATSALLFALEMKARGYNPFVLAAPGTDCEPLVEALLREQAGSRDTPGDDCYVNDFEDPMRPRVLRLIAGRGRRLRQDADHFVEDLRSVIPAIFEGEDFRSRMGEVAGRFEQAQKADLEAVQKEAETHGLNLLQTPQGFAFAPVKDGKVLDKEGFDALDEAERKRITEAIETMTGQLLERVEAFPSRQQELVRAQKALVREFVEGAVNQLVSGLRRRWQTDPDVLGWLEAVQNDVIEHAQTILGLEQQAEAPAQAFTGPAPDGFYARYRVNLLVDRSDGGGMPVVIERNPTLENLVGRLEYRAEFGNLVTDFTLIRAGALHRANGGCLILEAERLLSRPFAYDALKRALFDGEIRLETAMDQMSLGRGLSLEPRPIPLGVKVVLIGQRMTYYLLAEYDPDFPRLFKVPADFADHVERSAESTRDYARVLAALVADESLKALHRDAVARIVDHGARLMGDADKLAVQRQRVTDLVREPDQLASREGLDLIHRAQVDAAIEEHEKRLDRIRADVHERITRGTVLIDTEGSVVGQVNGLSVLQIGEFAFGQPSRITATARLGHGEVIDIEREARLGGAIHSKAVMILTAWLGQRFARCAPLSLDAALVFEQSYGGIEGDSATVAEACALLSAIGDVPLRQDIAVTGSMNQHGRVQAIGGANEKIEGFFDICRAAGLTHEQGVLMPADNVRSLMLRKDVVAAIDAGHFHVWSMEHIDDAMALLSGLDAGARAEDDSFPAESFCGRVQRQLDAFAKAARAADGDGVTRVERQGRAAAVVPGPPPGPEDLP
jgi:predicted ATP-dependent protease